MSDARHPGAAEAGRAYYIGLMSGTSLDAVDGVVADFEAQPVRVLAEASETLPDCLREELLALNQPGTNELHRAALAANRLADAHAQVVQALLARLPARSRSLVRAIGAHGQTVRHRPELGYSIQLNAPARLAEAVRLPVVADFRARDVAAGGQGAPLVPAFHQAVFAGKHERVILNLGGIANVSILPARSAGTAAVPRGFDTGPANMLLDLWCQRHTGQPYDRDGQWARQGRVDQALLSYLLASEPWLQQMPPKSTGRDLFNATWLDARLHQFAATAGSVPGPADVQATLAAFTAETAAAAIRAHAPWAREVFACGGGAHNPVLLSELAARLPGLRVSTTLELGVPPPQVEALAFAWLARAHVLGMPANVPAVTGAAGGRVLGAYYPA